MSSKTHSYSDKIIPLFAGLSVLIPIALIVYLSFSPAIEWEHITQNLLPNYVWQTVVLVLGVASGVAGLGFFSGYILGSFQFKGSKFLEWLMIMPLITPAYVLAIFTKSFFGFGGMWYQLTGATISLLNMGGAILIFSLSLFPYVYLPVKSFFENQGKDFLFLGSLYNVKNGTKWLRLVLPISLPFVLGGVILAVFEVLNDYGLCKIFGIQTLGVGIFRTWFGLGDMIASLRLAALLAFFALLIFGLDAWVKRRLSLYSTPIVQQLEKKRLSAKSTVGVWTLLGAIVILAIVIPVLEIIRLCMASAGDIHFAEVFSGLWGSIKVALPVSVLVVLVMMIVSTAAAKMKQVKWFRAVQQIIGLGYGIPGAIFGVGLLYAVLQLDKTLFEISFFRENNWFVSGSILALVWAISVRLFAVAKSPVENGVKTFPQHTYQVTEVFGLNKKTSFWKLELPMLKPYLLVAFVLVFIDTVKELPITLMLRPFNFNTLATKTFELANDELIAQAAWPALVMILFGAIPLLMMKNRLIGNDNA